MEANLMVPPASVVAPAMIQSELNRIWETLTVTNKMRASLFNLIIYTQKNERATYLHNIVQKVIEKFPSRILFVSVDKGGKEDYLKTSVSVVPVGKGEGGVACDLIEIDVSASQEAKVPFIILPHLMSDLPVYLVWAEDPSRENPLSYQLERLTERIIFDSETTDNLPNFARTILQHREKSNVEIADLNWGRMESWRELFSTVFYSDEKLEKIKKTKTLEIAYNAQETPFFCHTRIQSLYLLSWLATQLHWNFLKAAKDGENRQFFFEGEKGPLTASLKTSTFSHLSSGAIVSVDLSTSDECLFSFVRTLDYPHQVTIKIATPEQCEMPSRYIFSKGELGQALVKEITHKGMSKHYLSVLNTLSKMDINVLC